MRFARSATRRPRADVLHPAARPRRCAASTLGEAQQIGRDVHIGPGIEQLDVESRGPCPVNGFGEHRAGAPRDTAEQLRVAPLQSYQVVPPIVGRSQDQTIARRPQPGDGPLQQPSGEIGQVGADEDDAIHAGFQQVLHRARESGAEVSGALRHQRHAAGRSPPDLIARLDGLEDHGPRRVRDQAEDGEGVVEQGGTQGLVPRRVEMACEPALAGRARGPRDHRQHDTREAAGSRGPCHHPITVRSRRRRR